MKKGGQGGEKGGTGEMGGSVQWSWGLIQAQLSLPHDTAIYILQQMLFSSDQNAVPSKKISDRQHRCMSNVKTTLQPQWLASQTGMCQLCNNISTSRYCCIILFILFIHIMKTCNAMQAATILGS